VAAERDNLGKGYEAAGGELAGSQLDRAAGEADPAGGGVHLEVTDPMG
jgi:hypothetical protein